MTAAGAYFEVPWGIAQPASTPYPVWYDVEPQGRHSRLRVAFRLVLAVPQFIVVGVLWQIIVLVTVVGWLSILFTARYDFGLWSFSLQFLRRYARLLTYVTLLRDEYPPFGNAPYPVRLDVRYELQRSRARTFFRVLLLPPQLLVIYYLMLALQASIVLAWFAILITGSYPEGVRRLVVGLNRWMLRVLAYALLICDEYPPFSLGLDETPAPMPAVPAQPPLRPASAWQAYSGEESTASAAMPLDVSLNSSNQAESTSEPVHDEADHEVGEVAGFYAWPQRPAPATPDAEGPPAPPHEQIEPPEHRISD